MVLSPPLLETNSTVNTLLIRVKYVKTHFAVVRKTTSQRPSLLTNAEERGKVRKVNENHERLNFSLTEMYIQFIKIIINTLR